MRIKIRGESILKPVTTFDEARFPKFILDQLINTENFITPTPIQG